MKIADPLIEAENEVNTEANQFSFVGGSLSLDFTNTISSFRERNGERLTEYARLVRWGLEAGVLDEAEAQQLSKLAKLHPSVANQTLDQALTLRETIHDVFADTASGSPAKASDLAVLNSALSRAMAHARITKSADGYSWDWAPDAHALDRMLWPVVRSTAELLTSDHLDRVRECGGPNCTWMFLDMSRNHSRQWCDMGDCGNRAKARRYYQRTKKRI